MEIELVPSLGTDDPASRAVVAALEQEGLAGDVRPAASGGAWRRSGLQDAVERSVSPNGTERDRSLAGYVPPARSTRGAPRA